MVEAWKLIKELKEDPSNDKIVEDLNHIASKCELDNVKDFISLAIYQITKKVIYPFTPFTRIAAVFTAFAIQNIFQDAGIFL